MSAPSSDLDEDRAEESSWTDVGLSEEFSELFADRFLLPESFSLAGPLLKV